MIPILPQEDAVAWPVKLASTCPRRPLTLSPSLQHASVETLLHSAKFLAKGGEAPKLNRRPLPKELSLLHHVRIDLASPSPAPPIFLVSRPLKFVFRGLIMCLPLVPVFLTLHKCIFMLEHMPHASVETPLLCVEFLAKGGEAPKLNRRPLQEKLLPLHRVWIGPASPLPAPLLLLASLMPPWLLVLVFIMLLKYIFMLAHASVETCLRFRTKFLVKGGEALKLNRRPSRKDLLLFRSTRSNLLLSSPTLMLLMLMLWHLPLTRAILHAKPPMERPRQLSAIPLPYTGHLLASAITTVSRVRRASLSSLPPSTSRTL